MKKDFMSPKCFLNSKHNAVSPKGFGENGFDRPKMDVGDARKLLESLKKNGLEGEDERALDIVRKIGRKRFMSYVEFYTIENTLGELVFIPGTTVDRIIDDIVFNKELCNSLSLSLSFFRKNLEPKLGSTISFWAESNSWSGIISEHGVNYMNRKCLEEASFEAIWMDYDMIFPREVARIIASEYGMDEYHFSQWLNIASYVSGLSKKYNKLIDHVFLDEMECPANLSKLFPLWNSKVNMIGNLVLALDYLNKVEEKHYDQSLEKEVWDLLAKYSINPNRIGFDGKDKMSGDVLVV